MKGFNVNDIFVSLSSHTLGIKGIMDIFDILSLFGEFSHLEHPILCTGLMDGGLRDTEMIDGGLKDWMN